MTHMRKLILLNRISIDGYFASLNDAAFGMDWFVHDPEVDIAVRAGSGPRPDTLILGGVTYRGFERSWTPFLRDPNAPPAMKAVAEELTAMTKIVFSRRRDPIEWANTKRFDEAPADVVRRLKAEAGADMMIMGSGTICSNLANAGLIDEFVFIVTPVVAGEGKPLFDDVRRFGLTLQEARPFASGNVVLRYALQP